MTAVAFFAYPEFPPLIVEAVTGAVELSATQPLKLRPWQKMNAIGFKLDDLIRTQIHDVGVLVDQI